MTTTSTLALHSSKHVNRRKGRKRYTKTLTIVNNSQQVNRYLGAIRKHLGEHRDLVLVEPLPLWIRRDVPLLIDPKGKRPCQGEKEKAH
jgi:hypothetical protein